MSQRHYVLTVPVARDQTVSVWSNKPMKSEHFRKLDEYLALQKEIAAEGEGAAQAGRHPEGQDPVSGLGERSE